MQNEPKCAAAKKCGACQLTNMDYDRQLRFKQAKVVKLLGRYGRADEIIGMELPYFYRCKAQFPVRTAKNGNVITGVYQSSTRGIKVTDDCFLNNSTANDIVKRVRELMKELNIRPYDPKGGKGGVLRHVLVRNGLSTGEYMVVFVCYDDSLHHEKELTEQLCSDFPQIKTVVINISKSAKMTLGIRERVLYGEGYIEDVLCGKRFRISPRSFYQINPAQTEVLYKKAMEFAELRGKERVLDAYCGIGTIGICAADKALSVVGVEKNESAVKDARVNAALNGVKNAVYEAADAADYMKRAADSGEEFDTVFLDPPRAGCSREFLSALMVLAPKKVVYISCDPETLARDVYILTNGGYRVRKIQPVDMFPHTSHVETVVQLSRKKPDDTIDIDLELDELDITSAESKATYQQIKDYVLKEFGLKVSTLYISQVKRKCGLDVGKNYNVSRKEEHNVPKCPEDKERAIRAALKYFGMI